MSRTMSSFNNKRLSSKRPLASSRYVILASVLGFYISKYVQPWVLPLGPAEPQPLNERAILGKIDFSNDSSLTVKGGKLKKMHERVVEGQEPLMKGPETVVFGNDGTMYVLSQDAKLLKLTELEEQPDGTSILTTVQQVVDLGVGRPLGGRFDSAGTLWIADSILGLIRVKDPENANAKVELIASTVMVDGKPKRIDFADDVTIGPLTGKVYFSSASDILPEREGDTWDCLYASTMDLVRGGERRGKILEYDPDTDQVRVLASGIHFANGIAVDVQERYLIVSETMQARTHKYHLQGPKQGVLEAIDTTFPALPDGVDCNHATGLCYVALYTTTGPLSWIYMMPQPLDRYVRTLIMALPKALSPKPPPYGGVVEIDPETHTVVRILQDPHGVDVPFVAGMTVHEGKLYLGFLKRNFVAIYDLNG